MNTQMIYDQINDVHTALSKLDLPSSVYQFFSEKLIRAKEELAKNLSQAAVSGSLPLPNTFGLHQVGSEKQPIHVKQNFVFDLRPERKLTKENLAQQIAEMSDEEFGQRVEEISKLMKRQ